MIKMVSKKQLMIWRKEAKDRKKRSSKLSKQYGYKIDLLDLNPKFTAKKIKSSFTDAGHVNTRKKTIDVDQRIPKRLQHRVIKHEIEHIKHPRAPEKEIRNITKSKYGWKGFEKVEK